MKIISFNVNGIRAILKKGLEETLNKLDADIIFLQETKLSNLDFGQDEQFLNTKYKGHFTISKERKGYSGVAFLTKEEPLSIHYGLTNNEYDNEGRVITLEYPSFYLVGAYVPNSGEELIRLPFREKFEEEMAKYLTTLDKTKPLIYCGDLNVAHEEIDIKNPKANEHNAGFTKEERRWFSSLLSKGFIDTFRYFHKEEIKYSWWSYRFKARERNAGWRIDYFLVSSRFIDKVEDSLILTDVLGSDHCPIELVLKD